MFRYMFRYLMKFIIIIISFLCTSRSLPLAKRLSLLAECLAKRLSLLAERHTGRGKEEPQERQGPPTGGEQRVLNLNFPLDFSLSLHLREYIFATILNNRVLLDSP